MVRPGRLEDAMVEKEHLDEMEHEMGLDDLDDNPSVTASGALDLEDLDDFEIDEAALEQDLMALGNMFAEGDLMSGETVDIRRSSVQFVTGGEVSLNQSAALNVAAESARLSASSAGMVRAEDVTLDKSMGLVVLGNQVEVRNGLAGVVLGRTVNGQVRALMDLRGALMFGLGLSVGFTAVRMARNGVRALSGGGRRRR
jgi:hypothetical protein